MTDRNESVLAAFRREPQQTRMLLRFGVAGPLLIFAWNIIGGLFIDPIIVDVIGLLLTLIYGSLLAVLIVRIMYASGIWQVESRAAALRLSQSPQAAPRQPDGREEQPLAAMPPLRLGFQERHFLLQLKEEVAAARRNGEELALVWLDVGIPGGEPTQQQLERMAAEIAELLAGQSKTIGQLLNVSQTEYVFSLPHHGRDLARSFVSKVVQALGSYWCHCGLAVFPRDETDADSLFVHAHRLCQESREEGAREAAKKLSIA